MRILQISASYPPSQGGVATHVANLSHGLLKYYGTNYINVLTTDLGKGKRVYPSLDEGRLQIWKLKQIETINFYGRRTILDDVIGFALKQWHNINADIIHAHDFDSAYIGLMLKVAYDIPLIFTLHRAPSPWKIEKYKEDTKDLFMEMVKKYNVFDKIVVPSKVSAELLFQQGFNKDIICIIRHGVNIKYLCSFSNYKKILNDLGYREDKYLILCPVRADEHKNAEVFIYAASLIKKNNPDKSFIFLLTDEPSEFYKHLPALCKKLNLKVDEEMFFRKYSWKEMPTLYRTARMCIIPSIRESFGQTAVESQIFRTPVIAANAAALPEIITHKQNGLLFTPGSYEDLAKQAQTIFDNPMLSEIIVAKALKGIEEDYRIDSMVEDYMQLYSNIISNIKK